MGLIPGEVLLDDELENTDRHLDREIGRRRGLRQDPDLPRSGFKKYLQVHARIPFDRPHAHRQIFAEDDLGRLIQAKKVRFDLAVRQGSGSRMMFSKRPIIKTALDMPEDMVQRE